MRVLGIDPASAGMTGYGVVDSDGRHCHPVHFGAMPAPKKPRRAARNGNGASTASLHQLCEVHALVKRLLADYQPDAVALEGVFAALNVKTALRLSEVRGVVLLAAAQAGIPVHTYSPREVKSRITGYGHADKHQVQQMVRALLRLRELPQPPDAADALAVALCHIQCAQAAARFAFATVPRRVPISAPRSGSPARLGRIQHLRG